MKPRCGINSISYGWLLDKYFILLKGLFWLKQEVKVPFSSEPRDMGIYPMAISQLEHNKFP